MPFDKEKPRKPKTVYVKGHFRSKPKKTDEPKGPNPTIFLMLVKHDIRRWLSELCRRY